MNGNCALVSVITGCSVLVLSMHACMLSISGARILIRLLGSSCVLEDKRSILSCRLLQQRVRHLMPRRKHIMKQRGALAASWPWLARLHCILVCSCLPACLPACLPVCLSACLSVCLSVCLCLCLSAWLPVRLSVTCLPGCSCKRLQTEQIACKCKSREIAHQKLARHA